MILFGDSLLSGACYFQDLLEVGNFCRNFWRITTMGTLRYWEQSFWEMNFLVTIMWYPFIKTNWELWYEIFAHGHHCSKTRLHGLMMILQSSTQRAVCPVVVWSDELKTMMMNLNLYNTILPWCGGNSNYSKHILF